MIPTPLSTPLPEIVAPEPPPRPRRRWGWFIAALVSLAVLVLAVATSFAHFGGAYAMTSWAAASSVAGQETITAKKAADIETRLAKLRPQGVYLTVDTYRNRLRVWKDGEMLREAICSTGTGIVLRDPRNGKQWIFDTPLGERTILSKTKNPVWSKPDWAFIEEGYLPPPPGSPDRFDNISLGDFALYMQEHYIIHGTIFKTLLGQRVTHGCVRLGDADLEYVYKTVPVGARVFLY